MEGEHLMPAIPRESIEYVYVTVTRNGETVTDGIQFAITATDERPSIWNPATIVDGKTAYLTTALTEPTTQLLWVKTINGAETPIMRSIGNIVRT
jgi:hypothetical protein